MRHSSLHPVLGSGLLFPNASPVPRHGHAKQVGGTGDSLGCWHLIGSPLQLQPCQLMGRFCTFPASQAFPGRCRGSFGAQTPNAERTNPQECLGRSELKQKLHWMESFPATSLRLDKISDSIVQNRQIYSPREKGCSFQSLQRDWE